MLDSIKDWFVDRLHKYMDAAREIVENNEGIRSAETYYSTVKATLKKEAALLTKTFCIGMDKPDNTAAPTQPQEPPAKNDADGKAE